MTEMIQNPDDDIPPPFTKAVIEALKDSIESALNKTFQFHTHMDSWSVRKGRIELGSFVTYTVDMKQDDKLCSTFIMALDRETITKILNNYGVNVADHSPHVIGDAATEVANMIYGMFKTSLNKKGYRFAMSIPVIQSPDQDAGRFDNSEKMVLPFLTEGRQCRVVISHCH